MLGGIEWNQISSILEPSAGKGDIVEVITEQLKSSRGYHSRHESFDIDCIEIDNELQMILKGKGYRVIHNDFFNL